MSWYFQGATHDSYDIDRREGIWPGDASQKGHLSESSSIEAATWGINQTLRVHSEETLAHCILVPAPWYCHYRPIENVRSVTSLNAVNWNWNPAKFFI